MNGIDTSFNASCSMRIGIVDYTLMIHHLPQEVCRRQMMIIIKDAAGHEVFRQIYQWSKNRAVNLRGLRNGSYYLYLLFQYGEPYWSFFSSHPPELIKNDRGCWFTSSPFAVYNSMKINSWPTSRDFLQQQLMPDMRYQINDNSIIRCAKRITHGHLFSYTKILAVHDFVASEIAYDIDALMLNHVHRPDSSALATLQSGKGVCQGYTNLSIGLLRSLGIPAMQVVCYALGVGTTGGWSRIQNRNSTEANHVLTAAFVNDRWCLMDITWDSDLEFKGGLRREKTGCGLSHCFFDMTPTMLSFSHKLM